MNLGMHYLAGPLRNNQCPTKSVEAQKKGTSVMVLDGSLIEGYGSTGCILEVKTGRLSYDEIQRGAAPVDFNPKEKSSTRCEVGGILA